MSTQLIGFSIGGIARRFLVQPPSMIWPANLVTCALFNTLHSTEYAGVGNRGGYSRERFFYIALACSATWYLLPGYLFTALSYFSWGMCNYDGPIICANSAFQFAGSPPVCLVVMAELCVLIPIIDNLVVNQLFGVNYGLGMGVSWPELIAHHVN
jgi:hypothetical protein